MDAQQVHDLYLDVVAVGGQEVDGALLGSSLVAERLQRSHGLGLAHAHLLGQMCHAVHRAIPYDVFDVDVIAEKPLLVIVDVDDTHQSVPVLSEEVEETRVLAEGRVTVIGIIGG